MPADNRTLSRQMTVRLPPDLHEKARAKSARTGVAIAFIIRRALENWVKEDPPEETKAAD
jgi:predicted DNA-binding protein